jgi:hypothetical protein
MAADSNQPEVRDAGQPICQISVGNDLQKTRGGIIIVGGKRRRKMSAKARKVISDAQKGRWAKQKAGEKKK